MNEHVIIVNRWRERYADYERYVDHRRNTVSYITTAIGIGALPALAAAVRTVERTDDMAEVSAAVSGLACEHGPPARIIALKEDDLLAAAALREQWRCPGPRTADLIPFRDKYVMYEAIAAAGLPIDPFAEAGDPSAAAGFAAVHGWPVIVKPRLSSASEGVARVGGPEDLAGLSFDAPSVVQVYNPHEVYHVDGIFDGDRLGPWRAAQYINTCLAFRRGDFLGSVEEDNPRLNDFLGLWAQRFLRALSHQPVVFHLEVFVDSARRRGPRCSFLEAGARVGGGETALLWREVHGLDLMEQAFLLQAGIGLGEAARRPRAFSEVAGHLLVPAPCAPPCRITSSTPMAGIAPGPYAEVVPQPGDVVPAAASFFEHVGGRFRFRGNSAREVRDAVLTTAARYRVAADPVTRAQPERTQI